MNKSKSISKCPRCSCLIDDCNRLITDSCGHCKCRKCFLSDEVNCLDCDIRKKKQNQDVKKINNEGGEIKTATSGGKQYQCNVCNASFSSRSQQYYHLARHDDSAKKYVCSHEDCERRFCTLSHLNYHLESHNSNAYQCSICEKTFKNKIVWKKHEKSHIPLAEDNKCDICHKYFRNIASLTTHHSTVHTKQLPYQCELCENKYGTKAALQQHKLKHYDKKHECLICGKRFQRNSILKIHVKRHSKTEKKACPTCAKNFSDADTLMRHRKKHLATGNEFRCIRCDLTTMRKDNMQRHVRNMHTGVAFEDCVEKLGNAEGETPFLCVVSNQPKTVENSSVIKFIGNVEPVKVPNTRTVRNNHDNETKNKLNTLDGIAQTVKEKKYDPIKQYLKILNPSDETISEGECSARDIVVEKQHQRNNHGNSNFSEMHWRKNFKVTYEYEFADY